MSNRKVKELIMLDKLLLRLIAARIASVFLILLLLRALFTNGIIFEQFSIGKVAILSIASVLLAGGIMLPMIVIVGILAAIYKAITRKEASILDGSSMACGFLCIIIDYLAWVEVLDLWGYANITFNSTPTMLAFAFLLALPYAIWQTHYRYLPEKTN